MEINSILSVVQCWDKMMEIKQDKNNDVTTTYEFYKMLVDIGLLNYSCKNTKIEKWEKCRINNHYGYLEYILHRKYEHNFKCGDLSKVYDNEVNKDKEEFNKDSIKFIDRNMFMKDDANFVDNKELNTEDKSVNKNKEEFIINGKRKSSLNTFEI